jgi:hypothetical protein
MVSVGVAMFSKGSLSLALSENSYPLSAWTAAGRRIVSARAHDKREDDLMWVPRWIGPSSTTTRTEEVAREGAAVRPRSGKNSRAFDLLRLLVNLDKGERCVKIKALRIARTQRLSRAE